LTLLLFPRALQQQSSPAVFTTLIASLAAAAAAAGCVKRLPPAPTPQPVIPRIDAAPPPADGARLVVDVVEGPTPVQRIRMTPVQTDNGQGRTSFRFVERPEVLCTVTPCVTDLPRGNILIGFPVIGDPGATEVELVHVGPEPTVYRRSLSIYENRSGTLRVLGIVGTALGGTAAMTGAALLPIGLAKGYDGLTVAGGISLGAGAALLALGIWAIRHDAPTIRPGSSNHYPLTPAP
jgi:hypothetical protein